MENREVLGLKPMKILLFQGSSAQQPAVDFSKIGVKGKYSEGKKAPPTQRLDSFNKQKLKFPGKRKNSAVFFDYCFVGFRRNQVADIASEAGNLFDDTRA